MEEQIDLKNAVKVLHALMLALDTKGRDAAADALEDARYAIEDILHNDHERRKAQGRP